MKILLEIVSITFGAVATYFWFKSAIITIPRLSIRTTQPLRNKGKTVFSLKPLPTLEGYVQEQLNGDNEMANIAIGADFPDQINSLVDALTRQSILSARAAFFTGLSIISQLVIVLCFN